MLYFFSFWEQVFNRLKTNRLIFLTITRLVIATIAALIKMQKNIKAQVYTSKDVLIIFHGAYIQEH